MWHSSARRLFTIVHSKHHLSLFHGVSIIDLRFLLAPRRKSSILTCFFSFFRISATEDVPLHWPVLHKLSNVPSQWPQNAIVLPGKHSHRGIISTTSSEFQTIVSFFLGNEVMFSLETASDYMRNDRAITYGFKCLVIGYDWITSGNGLKNLEIELSFLGGACAASLMKRNLALPPVSSTYCLF